MQERNEPAPFLAPHLRTLFTQTKTPHCDAAMGWIAEEAHLL